jgi:hypothetical protein
MTHTQFNPPPKIVALVKYWYEYRLIYSWRVEYPKIMVGSDIPYIAIDLKTNETLFEQNGFRLAVREAAATEVTHWGMWSGPESI